MTPNVWKRTAAVAAVAAALAVPAASAQEATLNVVTAGDQNMVDYVTDYLGPMFEKKFPGVKVRAAGTGPGDAGSLKIAEKLIAQKDAGKDKWDVDVAVVHQKMAGQLVDKGVLAKYRYDIATGRMVTSEDAKNALGSDVDGYVLPMFHSQTAIAYNPALVSNPPKSYDALAAWAKANPKKFGYNGIKGGMSGQAFVAGWIYSQTGQIDKLTKGPYDPKFKDTWTEAWAKLKDFNQNVTLTPGNAGTLDMLGRGEIAMGPVWVDMFYLWVDQGRMPPTVKIQLISPGLPGQPMYYVVAAKAANLDMAKKFVEMATSPEVQAEGIVKRNSWYPGIDAAHLEGKLDKKIWDKLFIDVTPQDLATKGKTFPIVSYFNDILEGYEKNVAK